MSRELLVQQLTALVQQQVHSRGLKVLRSSSSSSGHQRHQRHQSCLAELLVAHPQMM
jgi:hypothetical protein